MLLQVWSTGSAAEDVEHRSTVAGVEYSKYCCMCGEQVGVQEVTLKVWSTGNVAGGVKYVQEVHLLYPANEHA